jgi:DNA-cytosine methyltransferase
MRYGDLFSGMGCFPLALKQLGIRIKYKFACDNDRHCKRNLLHNFRPEQFFDDIRDIKELPKVDVLTAGFPCQPFSMANRNNGGERHKSHDLFTELYRCLLLCDPDTFIFENVRGLTFKNNKDYFQYICDKLDESEYDWNYKIMDSKDYGSPMRRSRVYFIGHKKTIPNSPKFPIKHEPFCYLSDILDLSLPLKPCKRKLKLMERMEEGVFYIDNSQCSGSFMKIFKLEKDTINYCLISANYNCLYKKLGDTIYTRNYTNREEERLMGIYEYENICSPRQYHKQIGNGMDVSLLRQIIIETCPLMPHRLNLPR